MSGSEQPLWTLDLSLFGSFQVPSRFALEDVGTFFSEGASFQSIEVKNAPQGAVFTFQVYAESGMLASHIALSVTEQLLNVLAARCNLPLVVTRQEARPFARDKGMIKRTIGKDEWQSALRETHYYLYQEPLFLKALKSYRLALNEEHLPSRFALFFGVIEEISLLSELHSVRSHLDLEQIISSFNGLWGERSSWPYFRECGDIDKVISLAKTSFFMDGTRLPQVIGEMLERIEPLHRMAHACLTEWHNRHVALPDEFYHMNIIVDTGWGHTLQ